MSATWVALLRGMNVGGHRITNADLAAAFTALGMANVATYRASGNVIFDAAEDAAALTARIEEGLQGALGYAVPTYLRSGADFLAVAATTPFTTEQVAAVRGKPQVTFLGAAPSEDVRSSVLALATDEDRLVLEGRELYWLPTAGILQTKLDLRAIESLLGVGTMRTLGTVAGIAKTVRARA